MSGIRDVFVRIIEGGDFTIEVDGVELARIPDAQSLSFIPRSEWPKLLTTEVKTKSPKPISYVTYESQNPALSSTARYGSIYVDDSSNDRAITIGNGDPTELQYRRVVAFYKYGFVPKPGSSVSWVVRPSDGLRRYSAGVGGPRTKVFGLPGDATNDGVSVGREFDGYIGLQDGNFFSPNFSAIDANIFSGIRVTVKCIIESIIDVKFTQVRTGISVTRRWDCCGIFVPVMAATFDYGFRVEEGEELLSLVI